ncbi:Uncharacterised protein [Shigella sonnei]|nr:Uncharacterised protein [Shigella sonnei]CSS67976.1 Uncharacterised protein [Shigella sonnei]
MQQINGVIATGAANMDMLTKNGRLLDEIAKVFQRSLIALVIAYLLTLPFLKRVCATAANFQMMVCGCLQYDFLHR